MTSADGVLPAIGQVSAVVPDAARVVADLLALAETAADPHPLIAAARALLAGVSREADPAPATRSAARK